jgi:hypothetical protein
MCLRNLFIICGMIRSVAMLGPSFVDMYQFCKAVFKVPYAGKKCRIHIFEIYMVQHKQIHLKNLFYWVHKRSSMY